MDLFVLFLIIIVPIYAAFNCVIARIALTSFLAKEHPRLWLKLRVGDAMGEVGGYSGNLSGWVARREYKNLEDVLLLKLAVNYHNSKMTGVVCFLLVILGFGILAQTNG